MEIDPLRRRRYTRHLAVCSFLWDAFGVRVFRIMTQGARLTTAAPWHPRPWALECNAFGVRKSSAIPKARGSPKNHAPAHLNAPLCGASQCHGLWPWSLTPWVRKLKQPAIAVNVIEVVEINAPNGIKPVRWILFTSLPVRTFEEAWLLITYYELRWLIEEYHKALKTGCRTESRQLKTAGRLEAFVGLTSVVAIRLLQLKSLARTKPEVPAQRIVPSVWL